MDINLFTSAAISPATILITDDDPSNLSNLGGFLRPYFNVLAAPSGERALQIAAGPLKPDLILLDVLMPDMDGYDVLARLRDNAATRDIPVIFVTGLDSSEDEERGLTLGAVDYIAKPYRPPIILARVRTQLELKHARDRLANQNAYLEAEVESRTQDIQLIQDVTIKALAELAETRDPETGYHIHRTQEYVRILAERLQDHPRFSGFLTDKVVELLAKSAPLHDIGKVGIPDHILLKPGKLTEQEWAIMKTHSLLGAQAIERAVRDAGRSVEFLDIAKQITHFHHEKWDGSGYPDGQKNDAIPIPARLMAVADVFDALVSPRVYKAPMSIEQARGIIAGERGRHFDPDVVDAFLACLDDFLTVSRDYKNGDRPHE
ncbi:response regulator [Methylomonas sp. LL1]|uniref:response regulator n=1 Tax=Methylomonas sp. LL1 TaxID=2785785 RepID=UPI001E589319|nr:two-component system response regulator [Methylomonas sp. LL1]